MTMIIVRVTMAMGMVTVMMFKKIFLVSVNFYRFNAKSWHFRQILRENVAFFTREKLAFFGVNFILQKFCPCKKNDKYEVCTVLHHAIEAIPIGMSKFSKT